MDVYKENIVIQDGEIEHLAQTAKRINFSITS